MMIVRFLMNLYNIIDSGHAFFERHFNRIYFIYAIFTIALAIILFQKFPFTNAIYIPLFLAWIPMIVAAIKNVMKGVIGAEFFLVFATIFALLGNQEQAIMVVLSIMLIAHYLELVIEAKAHNALEKLIKLIPSHVRVLKDNEDVVVPLDEVTLDSLVIVGTGERIPVDGIVFKGSGDVNQSLLTGESIPQSKHVGDQVFAGTFIEAGSIIITAKKVQHDTLFARMTALLMQAEQKKAHTVMLAEKIVRIFTPALLIFIALVWFVTHNVSMVITLLIFGSPLELALVTPLTMLAGTFAALQRGILVKGGRVFEKLTQTDTIIFDKTGTLTLGEPTIVNIATYDKNLTLDTILTLAAIAEKRADHVVSKALQKKIKEKGITAPSPDAYLSLVGHGVSIEYDGKVYFFGNRHFIEAPEHGNSAMPVTYAPCPDEQIHSIFFLASEGKVIGKICMTDALRADAQSTIKKLRTQGIKNIILLSGDRYEITKFAAQQLNIDTYHAQVFPEEKFAILKHMQQEGHVVTMVGDGINDAAALKQADVGIALGAMGMEPAIDAADMVLMTNNLDNIVFARSLAQQVLYIIKQNIIVGFLMFHAIGIALTLSKIITPIDAAFAHGISDVFILLNASRLILYTPMKSN